ncbi:MAG: outer membrane protein assembly factor BamA [Bdellovibrionota bacterium]
MELRARMRKWMAGVGAISVAFALCLPAAAAPHRRGKKSAPVTSPIPLNADGSVSADPAVSKGSGEKILKVDVKGNLKIDREAILEKIGSKAGDSLDDEQVRKDIVAIHKLGYFDEIKVDMDGGTLTYIVKERPAINRIIFFGNDQISTDDLKGVLSIKTYDIYDENLVRESVRKLQKHYEDKGYYLAKIDYSVRPSHEKDMVEVLFKVREYDKVRIKKVTFLGNKNFTDDQLKKVLHGTQEGGFFSWATSSGNFKELDFKNDMQMLQVWYLNEGYVRFRHEPPIVTVSEDKKWVFITIKVEEGKKYNMGPIDFGGDLLFPKEELYDSLGLKTGNVFSIIKRNQDILALTEKYQDLGYANVNVIPNLDIHDDTLTVSMNYDFEKGTLVHFGRISMKGNTKTRDKVIRRELKIREGELYSGSGMRISKENITRLGFFDQESVAFQTKSPAGRPDIMDVEVNVKERPTGQFQLGAGYATTTKFFFTTQVSESNFLGKGQDLRFSTQISANESDKSFRLSFTDPYAWDTLWSVGGTLSYEKSNIPNEYLEFRKGMQLTLGHPIGEYTRIWFGYRLEQIQLLMGGVPNPDPFILKNIDFESGTISSVSVTVANDKRNDRLITTGGHYLSASEELAGIGGNRKFARTIGDARIYRKVWGDLTWRAKVEVGNIGAFTTQGVQSSEKFRLGGPNNMRGYPAFGVGPTESFGDAIHVTGGVNEMFTMWELEYPIANEIGLKAVAFYDAGNSFNDYKLNLLEDVGWGIRWFSPLGPLRFEWGYPLKGGQGSQFNFMIGPPF